MSRRRQKHEGITQMAWDYLNDCAVSDHPHGWEYSMLENNHLDLQTGYKTEDIWERFRDEILADWIKRKPGTRPTCWWRFDSGIQRKVGPMKLTETLTARNVIYSWCDSIPEDQEAWLKAHGYD